jgi:hypothetical protein
VNEKKARELLAERSGGVCEMCARARATDMHHRKNRSQGGTWTPTNLLHLCHEHHMHVTVNPAVAYEQGWSVRSFADPARTPVWLARRGWSFLTDDGGIIEEEAA